MVAKGELHLTGLLMIGAYLGGERHHEILERARFRSKSEIARLISAIDPKPEVPQLVEPIGPAPRGLATHREFVESLAGPVRTLAPGQRPHDWIEPGDKSPDGVEDATTPDQEPAPSQNDHAREPERPLHYKVQFTASQDYVDLLNEAFDLLGHETRRPDLPDLHLRAMRELVKQLKKRKRAATEGPPGLDLPKRAAAGAAETAPATPARGDGHDSANAAPAREQTTDTAPARYIPKRGPACRLGSRWRTVRLCGWSGLPLPRDAGARAAPSSRLRSRRAVHVRQPRGPLQGAQRARGGKRLRARIHVSGAGGATCCGSVISTRREAEKVGGHRFSHCVPWRMTH